MFKTDGSLSLLYRQLRGCPGKGDLGTHVWHKAWIPVVWAPEGLHEAECARCTLQEQETISY